MYTRVGFTSYPHTIALTDNTKYFDPKSQIQIPFVCNQPQPPIEQHKK